MTPPLDNRLGFPGRKTLYPQEVAAALSCSTQHVLDLVDCGRLNAIDIAAPGARRRALRIPISEYDRLINQVVK